MLEYAITFNGYSEEVMYVSNFWEWFAVGYNAPALHEAMLDRMSSL